MSTNHDSGAVDTPLGDVQGFEGAYAGSRWTFQGGSGNGFVDKTKLPNSIELRRPWKTQAIRGTMVCDGRPGLG
jgi:hypothetical protein